eukprot:gene38869-30762_t
MPPASAACPCANDDACGLLSACLADIYGCVVVRIGGFGTATGTAELTISPCEPPGSAPPLPSPQMPTCATDGTHHAVAIANGDTEHWPVIRADANPHLASTSPPPLLHLGCTWKGRQVAEDMAEVDNFGNVIKNLSTMRIFLEGQ